MASVSNEHIELDERGRARIAGKRSKVTQIVLDKRVHGWSPEEICAQYPHLTLAEVHAAFAYYYDHQAELDTQIEADYRFIEEQRTAAGESPVARKLRASAVAFADRRLTD